MAAKLRPARHRKMRWLDSPAARRWLALGAAVLLLGLGAGVMAWRTPSRRVTLPDGREFTVLAVTFGTKHECLMDGPAWLRPFVRHLPARWSSRLGLSVARHATPKPSLMVWSAWKPVTPTNQPARLASVADQMGRETEPRYPDVTFYMPRTGLIMAWTFRHFPRREGTVRFSIFDFGPAFQPIRRATLRLNNPARGFAAALRPTPLPAQVRDGPWTMRLTRFTTSPPAKDTSASVSDFARCWGTAFFQMQRDGQSDTAWTIESMELSDATGNHLAVKPVHRQQMGDEIFWLFAEPLWSGEPAVRVVAEFARARDFPAEETYTTPLLPVPTGSTTVKIQPGFERHGVTLTTVECESAPATGPRGIGALRITHTLRFNALPPTRGVHLRVLEVRDDSGRAVPWQFEYLTPQGNLVCSLALPPDARRFTARVAISKSRFAEFVITPTVVAP